MRRSVRNKFARVTAPDAPLAGVCRWCGGPITAPRRKTWCGQACVDEYRAQLPSVQRRVVFKRDHGVCAQCGRNCESLHNRVRLRLQRHDEGAIRLRRWLMLARLPMASWYWPRSFWEVDHIVPVVEGGGALGLANLRTLCLCCHRRETARLRARLRGRKVA